MKLLLLHGVAINSSRLRLAAFKQKFSANEIVVYESGTSIQEIMGGLLTLPLLSEQRLIILENPPEDLANYTLYPIPYLSEGKASSAYTLILWFDHEVGEKSKVLDWVKKNKGEVLYFPEAKEVSVFPFLDYLAAKDQKAFLEIEKLKKGSFDIHYLLTMTFYLLRNLVVTPKNAPEFVRKKLIRQRTGFSREKLTSLYKAILEIDFKIKSGLLEKSQAEFLLVNNFLK